MLQFIFYYIEVGRNYCQVKKRDSDLSLLQAMREGNEPQIALAKELMRHKFKRKAPIFSLKEFKVVCVKRRKTLNLESWIEDPDHTKYEPIVSTDLHDIFIIQPHQRINIRYQVEEREIEHRSLTYKDITPRKRR